MLLAAQWFRDWPAGEGSPGTTPDQDFILERHLDASPVYTAVKALCVLP